MTPHEMPAVLEYLQASFARRLGDAEVAVWAEELARWPQEVAYEAVRALRRTEDRLPGHATFAAAARAALPQAERDADRTPPPAAYAEDADGLARPVAEIPDRPALPPAPVETRREEITRARALIAAATATMRARSAALARPLEGEAALERLARTDAARPPAPFCALEDHARCGGPPVVSSKTPPPARPRR